MRAAFIPLALAALASALPKITRTGKYLYDESGNRFFIKGISYQPAGTLGPVKNEGDFPEPIDYVDILSDSAACTRDLPNLQKLTVNTVRVYSVDATGDHSSCMSALSGAGIYTIIDLSLPINGSITREGPTWTSNLLNLYLGSIDVFLKYDNVLAFNIGNEVVKDGPSTAAAPFIKAAARDIKAYLKSKGSSALVGYASTDGSGWRDPLAEYLTCDSEDTSIDLYGLNNYRWCGDSGSIASSYQESLTAFANLPVPAYFSEYGCNSQTPRPWTEVPAIYGTEMAEVYSGGIAFSYFPTNDNFGITTLDGDSITTTDEFDNLAKQLSAITSFPTTPAKASAPSTSPSTCPAQSPPDFLASSELPPTPNQAECDCTWTSAPCIFSPQTDNQAALFEDLFQQACSLLGQAGGSCTDIGANGTTGVYGDFSACDGSTKLTHVFSNFFLATDNNDQSCNFSGNATRQTSAPTDSSEINSAVSTCFSKDPTVFTPGSPTVTPGSGAATTRTRSGSTSTSGSNDSAGVSLFAHAGSMFAIATAVVCGLAAGLMTL